MDSRIEQADQIITSLLSPTLVEVSNMIITEDNKLVIICDDTVLYTTYLKDVPTGQPVGISYNLIGRFPNTQLSTKPAYIGMDIYIMVNTLYLSYMNSISISQVIAEDDDLLSNEKFDEYQSMKAADGMKYFPMPNKNIPGASCFVPMISGLVKLNKGDKCGIKIYHLSDAFRLMEFIITKKKISREIHMYYKTLNIN